MKKIYITVCTGLILLAGCSPENESNGEQYFTDTEELLSSQLGADMDVFLYDEDGERVKQQISDIEGNQTFKVITNYSNYLVDMRYSENGEPEIIRQVSIGE